MGLGIDAQIGDGRLVEFKGRNRLVDKVLTLPVIKSKVFEDEEGRIWLRTWHRKRGAGEATMVVTRRLTGVGLDTM